MSSKNETPEKAIASLIEKQWKYSKTLAQTTEKSTLDRDETFRLPFSCYTAEVLDKFITHDVEMIALKQKVQRLQCEDDPVLIIGESGTGKELIAQALHGRRSGKFVAINCTSLPDQLIESELFGHRKGSFTGALEDRPGKFREAWKGTLFLDEIGDMPINMQTKLLRVLQERKFYPIGESKEVDVECRVVAATNKTQEELLNVSQFRRDLFYRLAAFILTTKPLKERLDDIAEIVDSLGGHELITKLEKEGVALNNYFNLEGNVRSLQAQVRRWIVLGE